MSLKYPIYIPAKGRADREMTTKLFDQHSIAYNLVIEPADYAAYEEAYRARPMASIVKIPQNIEYKDGGIGRVRTWIKRYSQKKGEKKHWQIDDKILDFHYCYKEGARVRLDPRSALFMMESFTDRYSNIALSGPCYRMFPSKKIDPFTINTRIYSIYLIDNSNNLEFRGAINEDNDMCLQIICSGLCTLQFNSIMVSKVVSGKIQGGVTKIYRSQDKRIEQARFFISRWPGVATLSKTKSVPSVRVDWKKFKGQLMLKQNAEYKSFDVSLKKIKESSSKKVSSYYDKYGRV